MAEALNLWSGWPRMVEVGGNAFLFYVLIVVMVRLVGKRTTSELNNFDWIINVTIGSLAASGILLKNVATADAIMAIAVLAACQFVTTMVVQRSRKAADVVKAEPTLLTHKGRYLREAMERTRISEEEIRAALRQKGITENAGANWVVLETNGQLSVIPRQDARWDEAEALSDVRGPANLED